MNARKIVSAVALAASSCAASLFAYDWGGLINSDIKYRSDADYEFSFSSRHGASMWLKVPGSEDGSNYLIMEGSYEFEEDYATSTISNYIDLSLFKMVFQKKLDKGLLNLNIGRFLASDITGLIFYQNSDGALAQYEGRSFSASAFATYTGLLNGNCVKILNAPAFSGVDSTKPYYFADKYAVASAAISFPVLFANQTVTAQVLGTFRTAETHYNRMYASASITGPHTSLVFYKANSTLSLISYDDKDLKPGNMTNLSLTVYPFEVWSVSVAGTYTSEDFKGFTSSIAFNSLYEPDFSGLFKVGISTQVKPHPKLLISGGMDFGFNTAEDFHGKAVQAKAGVNLQAFTDLLFAFNFIQYVDIDDSDVSRTTFQLKAALSF